MPRHNKRKKQPDVWRQDLEGVDRKKPPRNNKLFVEYYQAQKFVPEGEWDKFYETLREDLPVTFRITGTRRQATQLLKIIKEQYLNNLTNLTVDDKALPPPKCLSWYPDELAWHIDTTKKAVRNNTLLKKFHTFLIAETESGNISRQEAVSMIPPLLLDVKPHHKILDMCAAPGSKTAQLIEYLHADESKPIPDGFIVANDIDNKRCYMMVHQVKRLGSPNCMVVNENAFNFPKLRSSREGEKLEFYLFDRVLADVPCSGDGTMRKNPDVWGKWRPIIGHPLHGLQIKILKRGLELLTIGGRLVYSTCSLNPVENEAVIAEMVRRSEGAIEIIDVSKTLPGLRCVPGLNTWRASNSSCVISQWHRKVPKSEAGGTHTHTHTHKYKFICMDKVGICMRVLPHHQNTGAFFICVIEKVRTLPWMKARKPDKEAGDVKNSEAVAMETTPESHAEIAVKYKDINATEDSTESENVASTTTQSMDSGGKVDETLKTEDGSKQTGNGATTTEAMESSDSVDVKLKTEDGNKDCKTTEGVESGVATKEKAGDGSKDSANCTTTEGVESGVTAKEKAGDGSKDLTLKRKADTETKEFQHPMQKKFKGYKEDPFLFVEKDDPIWPPIKDFYQLPDSFPRDQVLYRSEQGKKKTLYFVSAALKNVVECNFERVRFINMGVKFLSRSASPLVKDCDFRITQESLAILGNIYESRTVDVNKNDVEIILSQDSPYTFKFSEPVRNKLDSLSPGSVVFRYKPTESNEYPDCELLFCAWRGNVRARSYVPKFDRQHFLVLFGWNVSELRAKLAENKPQKLENSSEIGDSAKVDSNEDGLSESDDEIGGHLGKMATGDTKEKCSETTETGKSTDPKIVGNEKSDGKCSEKIDAGKEMDVKMETGDQMDVKTVESEKSDGKCSEKIDAGKEMDVKMETGDQIDVKTVESEKSDGKCSEKIDKGERTDLKVKSEKECSQMCEDLQKASVDNGK
ncbi:RNA cytosine C(5)-methyltransferase NSUN2-like [Gigantopelta aegis]|uniref:RNA cytosine C(5)-methyltransferase NSUN2-like n=1 Tax=Gigantopelta aegis TaxID=1735272 RepID=UPI001B88C842|nr:RNA cytosine C(5)-methyltransferase NSUN2-like [Gigantopelta aegis]